MCFVLLVLLLRHHLDLSISQHRKPMCLMPYQTCVRVWSLGFSVFGLTNLRVASIIHVCGRDIYSGEISPDSGGKRCKIGDAFSKMVYNVAFLPDFLVVGFFGLYRPTP